MKIKSCPDLSIEKIPPKLAQLIIVNSQLLNKSYSEKNENLNIIDHLGYIQIDTISVINRSHNHTLWTRNENYKEADLHELQSVDKKIFEYWAHAMAYLPMDDYRFYLSRMENFHNPKSTWTKNHNDNCKKLFKPILERIKSEGSLSSKDFSDSREKGGTWWDWKPAKVALELLFWRGDLMISERKKFQKFYNLTERVLPNNISLKKPSDYETAEFIVLRAIKALGIAERKEIQKFLQPESSRDSELRAVSKKHIDKAINNLLDDEKILAVEIEGIEKTEYFLFPETLRISDNNNSAIHFLSPFDNLIIQRQRINKIFNFDYSLECYIPTAKRKFGYFVLPILWENKFIARADLKADRRNKVFLINNLHFEDNTKIDDQFLSAFSQKIIKLSEFNNCNKIQLLHSNNKILLSELSKKVASFI
ncbi:MAG: YcaQ family DNA glycosylase [Melioribacteraceae bacterium]|nr:YcaQ family DNA glycosylase [Melioribacteraceae bacterium]